jgi:Rad3-related DNA helicase
MSVTRRLAGGYLLDDPVLAARITELNKQGRNAFMEYQLPCTIINLKQSV